MVRIRHPDSRLPERQYILHELLEHRLGVAVSYHAEQRTDTLITFGDDGHELSIADGLLGIPEHYWLALASLPGPPHRIQLPACLHIATALSSDLPILPVARATDQYDIVVARDRKSVRINQDVLGSAFFFLTRYEEIALPQKDRFERFPADAAYAQRYGFLERAVVDDYAALIKACISVICPSLVLRQSAFRMEVSHDVDLPLRHAWARLPRMLGGGLRDLVRSGSLRQFTHRTSEWYAVRHRGQYDRDPYNTFDALMKQSERRGLRSAFYFITDRPAGNLDALYEIDDPFIQNLIGRIHRSGHEIGLHASFNSYLDPTQTRREFDRLLLVCERQQVKQDRWGGRQHFLRWRVPHTYRNWEGAGLDYDSTLGFAQRAGFRCGTSHEFRPFDLLQRRTLGIVERPLVVMDGTVMDYMKLGTSDAAIDVCLRLKDQCRAHGGVFSLLWHNSMLTSEAQWRVYTDVLDG